MMAITVICPRCGRSLTVSITAPMQLTCPRCLAKINREPTETEAETSAAPLPLPAPSPRGPMRVLPLDEQANRDSRLGAVALLPLGLIISVGLFAALYHVGTFLGLFVAVIAIILTVLAAIAQSVNRQREITGPNELSRPFPVPPPLPPSTGSHVIDYRRPRPYGGPGHPGMSMGAFAAGLFVAIAVCAGCFMLMAATAGSGRTSGSAHGLYFSIVLIAVIGTGIAGGMIGGRWPGYGAGTATGLALGVAALAPCAFCYLAV